MPKGVYPHKKGRPPWNKGLTKETDERVRKVAENKERNKKISIAHTGRKSPLKGRTYVDIYGSVVEAQKQSEKRGRSRRGKTCEEIYGVEEGKQFRENSRKRMLGVSWEERFGPEEASTRKKEYSIRWQEHNPMSNPKTILKVQKSLESYFDSIRGKTAKEIYGEERSVLFMEKRSRGLKRHYKIPGVIEGRCILMKEVYRQNPELKQKRKIIGKELWSNPDYVKNVIKGLHNRPTTLELKVKRILEKVSSLEWIYTGGGFTFVAGKIPDFVNYENKKIVEAFGDYWHKPEEEEERIEFFKKHGYDCLVIWGHEFSDVNSIIDKIKEFEQTYG